MGNGDQLEFEHHVSRVGVTWRKLTPRSEHWKTRLPPGSPLKWTRTLDPHLDPPGSRSRLPNEPYSSELDYMWLVYKTKSLSGLMVSEIWVPSERTSLSDSETISADQKWFWTSWWQYNNSGWNPLTVTLAPEDWKNLWLLRILKKF